ncbi:hypothetical protein MC7420_282 [Coleofasciculus chthonoplastes PCC 7420]|uniref:Uncharacterized protein n=1 Tax=Coleofasciculus chthonoplastes PCC 7420 TaxID=118168 RepID=B4VL31_9CYAN|nr:hypothetical protein MC7420_282 [Coleofasciculus chthonoplastes PCC 7420]
MLLYSPYGATKNVTVVGINVSKPAPSPPQSCQTIMPNQDILPTS